MACHRALRGVGHDLVVSDARWRVWTSGSEPRSYPAEVSLRWMLARCSA